MFEKNYQLLASAVVGQACEDYCYALRNKQKYNEYKGTNTPEGKKYKEALNTLRDCRDFFKDDISYYIMNPPKYGDLMKRLRYVAIHPDKYKIIRFLKNVSMEEEHANI